MAWKESYDVAVVGGGHAGIEAAVAAARLGARVALFTLSLDAIGNLPCNPSIGGTAKGHLVREIDALGGCMGLAADATFLQSRMLNKGKGPAVHSLRVQTDRALYHLYAKKLLENTPGLYVKQAEVVDIQAKDGKIEKIITGLGGEYAVKAVILATGTYLGGKIFIGDAVSENGPDGVHAAKALTASLQRLGLSLRRFKTGTPARVHRRSIDFSRLAVQRGDEPVVPLSFLTRRALHNQVDCHIAYTNTRTHEVIKKNLHRSPLYGGQIEGIGPRYCPSIEDKVVRFAEKDRHQVFVEPCGLETDEMYLQGLSSSLPEDVQHELYRTIEGFENLEIMRPAYAIEYDCIDPIELLPSLESIQIKGLYGAGQFNGTSGYEEAAAQGLVAGINAARAAAGIPPVYFARHQSYIGTLIDDLVTKGTSDPYRMMTSRSEYRLYLRQDNADERLTPLGREIGLVGEERWQLFEAGQKEKQELLRWLGQAHLTKDRANRLLKRAGSSSVQESTRAEDLLRRPEVHLADILQSWDESKPDTAEATVAKVETEVKYAGYIARQKRQIDDIKRQERREIPSAFSYKSIQSLRLEAREKLEKVRPLSLGQASRIPGVTPSDIAQLSLALALFTGKNEETQEENGGTSVDNAQ